MVASYAILHELPSRAINVHCGPAQGSEVTTQGRRRIRNKGVLNIQDMQGYSCHFKILEATQLLGE